MTQGVSHAGSGNVDFFGCGQDDRSTKISSHAFDSILDNVNFSGSGFSFFNRQGVGLTQTGGKIVNRFSLLSDLRSSKGKGQSSFVNPGLVLLNVGMGIDLTTRLRGVININRLWFAQTEPLESVLQQQDIAHCIGEDYSIGVIYRPFLNQNVVASMGISLRCSGAGFRDIQVGKTLYSSFFSLSLVF